MKKTLLASASERRSSVPTPPPVLWRLGLALVCLGGLLICLGLSGPDFVPVRPLVKAGLSIGVLGAVVFIAADERMMRDRWRRAPRVEARRKGGSAD